MVTNKITIMSCHLIPIVQIKWHFTFVELYVPNLFMYIFISKYIRYDY